MRRVEAAAIPRARRRAVEAARAEIEALLATSREGAAPVALDISIRRLTRVDALQQQSMARANLQASKLRLRQVVAALGRLERGCYGECLGCGEPIALARRAGGLGEPTAIRDLLRPSSR